MSKVTLYGALLCACAVGIAAVAAMLGGPWAPPAMSLATFVLGVGAGLMLRD